MDFCRGAKSSAPRGRGRQFRPGLFAQPGGEHGAVDRSLNSPGEHVAELHGKERIELSVGEDGPADDDLAPGIALALQSAGARVLRGKLSFELPLRKDRGGPAEIGWLAGHLLLCRKVERITG